MRLAFVGWARLKGMGHGKGLVWLAECFFGDGWCSAGLPWDFWDLGGFGWALGQLLAGVALLGSWCLYLKAESGKQGVAPKPALHVEDAEPSLGLERVNGTGLPGPELGVCRRQVSGWADSGCGWA